MKLLFCKVNFDSYNMSLRGVRDEAISCVKLAARVTRLLRRGLLAMTLYLSHSLVVMYYMDFI